MSNSQWNSDPSHSELGFKVRHLMTQVSGNVEKFEVSVQNSTDDFTTAKVNFSAESGSINTNNEQRDGHLKSPDFFDVKNHPQLNFASDSITKETDGQFIMHGQLTIKETTHPVQLNVEHHGVMKDPYGNAKSGFSISGKINRKDWGLEWNSPLETGGVLLGDEIKINGEIQLLHQS